MTARPSVAIVTTYYRPVLGGAESAAEHLATYLVRRGHEVLVVTKRTSTEHPREETRDGVRIIRTPPLGARRASGKWFAIPWIVQALLRHRSHFRVICCVDFRGIGIAALIAGHWTGSPVIFHAQTEGALSGARLVTALGSVGVAPHGSLARVATWPIRAVYGRARAILCISRSIEREALACGIPRDRVAYVPNPVDAARFTAVPSGERPALRRSLGLPVDATIAVYVGRLSREKGVMDLVEAWSGLNVPNTLLLVVGPDMTGNPWDVGPAARALVADRGIGASVRFVGGQPSESIAKWLQCADLAVQPSHFEAFGMSAAEAMAVGLPVIASDVGGLRDFVKGGVNGLLVPPHDPPALREALRRLLTDAPLRQRLGQAAVATGRSFDEHIVLEMFATRIDQLAGL